MDEFIYGVIKENGKRSLRKVYYRIRPCYGIPEDELKKFHAYSPYLHAQYSDCISSTDRILLLYDRKKREEAVRFEQSTKEFQNLYGNNIVAMSHRHGGWYGIDWDFNEDISFHISTNFGFGSSSYFYAIFKYKDVLLAPYSFYVKYRYSTYASVVRCTYEYPVEYSSWDTVMSDCLDFYNAIVSQNDNYVFTWLNKQLSIMVSGLERLITSSSNFFYDEYVNKSHASGYAELCGDDFYIVKSKKIAFSLDFIDNIKILPVQVNSAEYIKRIYSVCEKFQPSLIQKIKDVNSVYNTQKNELDKLKDILNNSDDYALYTKLEDKFYYRRRLYLSKFRMVSFYMRLKARIAPTLMRSEIRTRINVLKKLFKDIEYQESKVKATSFLLEELNKCNDRMNIYFNNKE